MLFREDDIFSLGVAVIQMAKGVGPDDINPTCKDPPAIPDFLARNAKDFIQSCLRRYQPFISILFSNKIIKKSNIHKIHKKFQECKGQTQRAQAAAAPLRGRHLDPQPVVSAGQPAVLHRPSPAPAARGRVVHAVLELGPRLAHPFAE
jgi:hypothetical protein